MHFGSNWQKVIQLYYIYDVRDIKNLWSNNQFVTSKLLILFFPIFLRNFLSEQLKKNFSLVYCSPVHVQNRARTGPEQGFLCVVILTGKNLFSLQGTPLFIAGILCSLQGCPCENYYTGLSLFTSQIQFAFQLTL